MTDNTTTSPPAVGDDAAAFFERGMHGDPDPGFRYLAEADPQYLGAYQEYAKAVYGRKDAALSTRARQLIVVALLAGTGEWHQMRTHTRRALLEGATPAELLQALEYAAVACGASAIVNGARILGEEVAANPGIAASAEPPSPDTAQVERNKRTFRRLQEEVIAGGHGELAEEIFSPDFRTVRAGLADLDAATGRPHYDGGGGNVYDRFRAGLAGMRTALADQEREILDLYGTGNHVWARWRITATHAGPFLGIPATGRKVEFTETALLTFADDGRILEGWFLSDELGLALRLGLRLTGEPEA